MSTSPKYVVAAAAAVFAAAALTNSAAASITAHTGDSYQVVNPPFALLGWLYRGNPSAGACIFDERQGVAVSNLAVDQLGNGALGVPPAGVLSGVVDSHFLHLDIDTTPANGIAAGSVTFSGQIMGVAYRQHALDASDALTGLPGTLYETGNSGPGGGTGRASYLPYGQGTFTVNGPTFTFSLVNTGSGEWTDLRIFTQPLPAPGAAVLGALALAPLTRRRRTMAHS